MSDNTQLSVKPTVNEALSTASSPKELFSAESVRAKFHELLGKKAQGFIVSVLQIVNSNELLKKASPASVYNAAATAAAMDLPINQNLGFAWIVPYKGQASFQMGWKGYVQLAQRTGLYKTIGATEVYENQIETIDYITKAVDFKNVAPEGAVVGFYAYFTLLNGFEKSYYLTKDQITHHAKKYSQSFKKNQGVWAEGEDGFNAMAKKTALKLLLAGYGPLSIEMQTAVKVDQAVIQDENAEEVLYVDNEVETPAPDTATTPNERAVNLINTAKSLEELNARVETMSDQLREYFREEIVAKEESFTNPA